MEIQKKNVVMPEPLRRGDCIGVVAPASPVTPEAIRRGTEILKAAGLNVFLPDGLFGQEGYLAGADTHRAGLVNTFFANKHIRGIFCARGGFGSMRMLPLLDFDMIRNNPKIFMGFSDVSALLLTLYRRCGLITFHGPVLTTLGFADPGTVAGMTSALFSATPPGLIPDAATVIRPGRGTGTIAGGNLSTLCHLTGTPFAPCFDGHILFLEDVGEPVYKIDRMLTQMGLAGCFEGLRGLMLGTFEGCGTLSEIYDIADQVFGSREIPIMGGFDIGHGTCNLTLPIGAEAVLDTDQGGCFFKRR